MAALTGRDLRALFEPRSVAVVGASNDAAKWGCRGRGDQLVAGFQRRVHDALLEPL